MATEIQPRIVKAKRNGGMTRKATDSTPPKGQEISFSADTPEMGLKEGDSSVGPLEEEKNTSKLQLSFISEDILKKAKQILGPDTIFITLGDFRNNKSGELIYNLAKRNVLIDLRARKLGEELLDDFYVEEMLRNAVQEAHRRIIINRESEWLMERMDIMNALTEAQNEIKLLRGKIEKEKEIPKTKEELLMEIKSLTAKNKKLMDTVEHLNADIKQQTTKFKENEQKLKEEIAYLEIQAKSTQTEEFKKLKEDNKRLIEQNNELKVKCEKRKESFNKCKKELLERAENENKMKEELSNEINELLELKKKLSAELNKVEAQKKEIEDEKERMIKQIIMEKNKILEMKAQSEHERQKIKAAHIENTIKYMTSKVLDVVTSPNKVKSVQRAKSRPSHKVCDETMRRKTVGLQKPIGITKEIELFEEDHRLT